MELLSVTAPSETALCNSSYNSLYIYIRHTHKNVYICHKCTHRHRYIEKFTSVTFKYLSLFQSSCNKSDFYMHIINELNPVITSVTHRALRTWENLLGKQVPRKRISSPDWMNSMSPGWRASLEKHRGKTAASMKEKKLLTNEKKKIKIRALRRKTNKRVLILLLAFSLVGFLPLSLVNAVVRGRSTADGAVIAHMQCYLLKRGNSPRGRTVLTCWKGKLVR